MTTHTESLKILRGAGNVIGRFTFRQVLKGAIILGLAVSVITAIQALGYIESYPTVKERTQFAATLEANPSFNLLYGEPNHLTEPAGYMVYRVTPFVAFIASFWGLLVATRLLRGQEEDGRLEILLTGRTSNAKAVFQTILGIGAAWLVVFLIATVLISLIDRSPELHVNFMQSAYFAFSLTSGAALFASLGALTSQLAGTRRKAVLFGVVPLIVFFIMRSIGNTVKDLAWLKDLTPFGWIDHLQPIYNPQISWMLPIFISIFLLAALSVYIASKRDYGESIIPEPENSKPHYGLLGGSLGLYIRLSKWVYFGWGLGALIIVAIMVNVARVANQAVADSQNLTEVIGKVSGGNERTDMTAAFIGMGGLIVVLILMAMVIWSISQLKGDEAKGLLDNFLARKTTRTRILLGRLFAISLAVVVIYVATNVLTLAIANLQNIELSTRGMLIDNLNGLGPIALLLGLAVALFSLMPRRATIVLYVLLAWSFLVQTIAPLISNENLRDLMSSTSLLQPIALVPLSQPDWTHFWLLMIGGVVLAAVGIWGFTRRDLAVE